MYMTVVGIMVVGNRGHHIGTHNLPRHTAGRSYIPQERMPAGLEVTTPALVETYIEMSL